MKLKDVDYAGKAGLFMSYTSIYISETLLELVLLLGKVVGNGVALNDGVLLLLIFKLNGAG